MQRWIQYTQRSIHSTTFQILTTLIELLWIFYHLSLLGYHTLPYMVCSLLVLVFNFELKFKKETLNRRWAGICCSESLNALFVMLAIDCNKFTCLHNSERGKWILANSVRYSDADECNFIFNKANKHPGCKFTLTQRSFINIEYLSCWSLTPRDNE